MTIHYVFTLLFWTCIFVILYSYILYGIVLYIFIFLKNNVFLNNSFQQNEPSFISNKQAHLDLTLVVAAYNEADYIAPKIANSLALEYPVGQLHFLFVTDGSTDNTPDIVRQYPQIQLCHLPERKGKIAAVERIMPLINTPITVFTDANTFLNSDALLQIVRHYANPQVGAVAGEKRIAQSNRDAANAAGEGLYWQYESLLKKWDWELYSVVGAAGELFSIRTHLYQPVPPDTIIEDFYLTLGIAQRGYRVAYEPQAYAVEQASASVAEEMKRKIRIAAGGLQAIIRLYPLLNPFRYGILSFQYISHRVLRWTLAPLALPLVFILNLVLAQNSLFYQVLFVLQCAFYAAALAGYLLESRRLRLKIFFIPYYFCMMNYAVYRGAWRMLRGSQSVVWEKAKRATAP